MAGGFLASQTGVEVGFRKLSGPLLRYEVAPKTEQSRTTKKKGPKTLVP
jgi:hypothetical protein